MPIESFMRIITHRRLKKFNISIYQNMPLINSSLEIL